MSRRGCSLPANASGFDPHRASITSRFGQVHEVLDATAADWHDRLLPELIRVQEVWFDHAEALLGENLEVATAKRDTSESRAETKRQNNRAGGDD
jgi:hypothetical protein